MLIRLIYSSNKNIRRSLTNGISAWNEELSTELKHRIERNWAAQVESIPRRNENKSKYYVLSMFPYPSGQLHMGHVRVYTISDVISRYQRMNGKHVIHPIGWDAFGLPAENAAIEKQLEPAKWTQQNITYMKTQLKRLACTFDWDREINTSDPSYYQWTQYIFLKLFQAGLVYQKKALVNWDPIDQTVLADEQVDANGCSWRSGAKVEKKLLKQWFVKSTLFSKSLSDGLDDPLLENWRDIIALQRHWIGDCNGYSFNFELKPNREKNVHVQSSSQDTLDQIQIWTPNPEWIPHSSFIAISPNSLQHKLDLQLESYQHPDGICIKLATEAINPFTQQTLPMYITDLVQYPKDSDYYLATPAFCESDRQLAQLINLRFEENSMNDETINKERNRICQIAQEQGFGGHVSSSRLRDWLISRQRYWGTPIPIVYCESCGGPQPVPEHQLPVVLPKLNTIETQGRSPLQQATEWMQTTCPKCQGPATRECDTLDTFVDSSWYFLRFLDPKNTKEPFSKNIAHQNMPVDVYIGGKEHGVLHLYFARLMNHFLYSLDLVPHKEPFKKLLVQGMVMGESYKIKKTGRYITKEQVDFSGNAPFEKGTNEIVQTTWEKMSKSKYNGMEPTEMFDTYGIDATRLLILADVAPQSNRHFSPKTFPAFLKWQNRVWLTLQKFLEIRQKLNDNSKIENSEEFLKQEDYFYDCRNYHLKGVNFHFEISFLFNMLIMKLQGITNQIRKATDDAIAFSGEYERALALQIILLAPVMPHFALELWSGFLTAPNRVNKYPGQILWDKNVLEQPWPQLDDDYLMRISIRKNQKDKNQKDIASTNISYKIFKNLTLDESLKYFNNDENWENFKLNNDFNIKDFKIIPHNAAFIYINTPKKEKIEKAVAAAADE